MSERNKILDALKGIAIFLVILGHTIYWIDSSNYSTNLIFILIYTFHMPLFFFISGFLAYNRFDSSMFTWIRKKFRGLIIPYIIFTIFYFYIIPGTSRKNLSFADIIINIYNYNSSAWFLPILFEGFVVLSVIIYIDRIMKNKYFILFLTFFLIIFPLISFKIPGSWQIKYYTMYLVIGYYIHKFKYIFEMKTDISQYFKYPFLIFGILLFPLLFLLRSNLYFNNEYFKYILAFSGIIFSYIIIKFISKSKSFDFFVIFGVYSLELYLIHLIIGNYSSFLEFPIWFGSGILKLVSGTLIILTFSLGISYILSYNEKISKFLFGRWPRKDSPENKNNIFYLLVCIIVLLYALSILIRIIPVKL